MTKTSSFIVAVACITMLAACNSTSYKKTSSGLLYKIIHNGNAPQVKAGQIIKLNFTQKLNDSLLGTSYDKMPAYAKIDLQTQAKYDPSEIFHLLHNGDSAVIVFMVDSLMSKMPTGLPPYMHKGDKITLGLKVVDVFNIDSVAMKDREKEMTAFKARMEKENAEKMVTVPKEVEKYITDKKINAKKSANGTYVEIKTMGTGAIIDSGKTVTMLYTGKFMATGKEFETNIGPGKQPLHFVVGQKQVIPGWDEGLKGLTKGTKATLYIPGTAAYGAMPPQGSPFKPFENLIFDVEVVDVADAPAVPAMPKPDSAMHK